MLPASTFALFIAAALAEIAGCFAFWAWWRLDKSAFWLLPGLASLAVFALLLSLSDMDGAGRAFAAYGGVYIIASLLWLRLIEGIAWQNADLIGAAFCLVGASVIMLGRTS